MKAASRFTTAHAKAARLGRVDTSTAAEPDKLSNRVLISEGLNQLHPSHRDVIVKASVLGWTTSQIAADLHVPESVVKCALHHAMHNLWRILNDARAHAR